MSLHNFQSASQPQDSEDKEAEDSDEAPEEATLSKGKEMAEGEDEKLKKEIMKLKDQVKEARKRKLERNKDQQAKKVRFVLSLSFFLSKPGSL